MKKIIYIFFLLSPFFLNAQDNSNIPLKKALLWEISGNNLTKPSYIFGTMHIMPANEFFFPKKTFEKLENCKTLALEVDINIPLKEQVKLAQSVLLPSKKTVKDFLSEKEYKEFKFFLLDSLDLDKKKYKKYIRFKPFYIYSLLLAEKLGKVKSYEKELNKKAKRKGLSTIGLESIDFQMSLVDKIPIKEQALSIIGANLTDDFYKMMKIYKKQNLNVLFQMSTEDPDFKEMESSFLIKRNNKWIPIIEKQIKKEPTFIAVGAAHIAGSLGIINQLRTKGYKVEPVK